MESRDVESILLDGCVDVARGQLGAARDGREANVFRLASLVIESSFPLESLRLMEASKAYISAHPEDEVALADIVKNGWVISLPRLRDMLSERFQKG